MINLISPKGHFPSVTQRREALQNTVVSWDWENEDVNPGTLRQLEICETQYWQEGNYVEKETKKTV